jgi:pimeloyl-ACP methyl ester carboxylesterase
LERSLFVFTISLLLLATNSFETRAQEPVPRLEPSECLIEVHDGPSFECGTLITLEDYDNPGGQTVRLPIIVIHSRYPNPSKEVLLFTEGGPGFSSLDSVRWLASTGFWEDRDVVILEQRGNKYAQPSLICDFSVWWEEGPEQTPCLDSLLQQGITLEHYTSASIAEDINALKQILDYDTWILFGTSYSTRPMQLVMERYPGKIRSVVLHSVSPITDTRYRHDPEHSVRAIQIMLDDCAADPACAEAFPDLERKFYDLVRKLNAEPVIFEMTLPHSDVAFPYEVNGSRLIGFLDDSAFYRPAHPPFETAYLPLLIDKVSQGNAELLYPWAKNDVSTWGDEAFAWGLYFAINCQEDVSSVTSAMVDAQIAAYPELDGYYRHRDELAVCAAWGLEADSSLPSTPIVSDIPVLVLAGRYDPITPPEWSRTAITNLSNSTFIEFPASGHSVITDNPCAQQIISAFLAHPDQALDLSCMDEAAQPNFVLPNEIITTPAMYEIHYDELGYSMLEENLFLGSWLTLIATGIVALIASLVLLVRRKKQTPTGLSARLTLPLLIVLSITSLLWGYALRFSLQSIAATSANVLRFGLPVAYWWIFLTAILIGIMTIFLIVVTVQAWRRRNWSLIGRVALTVTTLAACIFCGMLANWGLFTALLG